MSYIFFIGILVTTMALIAYKVLKTKAANEALEISWKKSILKGTIIYLLTIFLGTFFTSVIKNAYDYNSFNEYIINVLSQTFGMFIYAFLYTFILVLPAMIIGLKYLSKTGLTKVQKQTWFAILSFVLVIIINLIMSGFFRNQDFILFLLAYSFFGVATPWTYVTFRNVF